MPNSAKAMKSGHLFRGAGLGDVSPRASHAKTSSEPHQGFVENVLLFAHCV